MLLTTNQSSPFGSWCWRSNRSGTAEEHPVLRRESGEADGYFGERGRSWWEEIFQPTRRGREGSAKGGKGRNVSRAMLAELLAILFTYTARECWGPFARKAANRRIWSGQGCQRPGLQLRKNGGCRETMGEGCERAGSYRKPWGVWVCQFPRQERHGYAPLDGSSRMRERDAAFPPQS